MNVSMEAAGRKCESFPNATMEFIPHEKSCLEKEWCIVKPCKAQLEGDNMAHTVHTSEDVDLMATNITGRLIENPHKLLVKYLWYETGKRTYVDLCMLHCNCGTCPGVRGWALRSNMYTWGFANTSTWGPCIPVSWRITTLHVQKYFPENNTLFD